MMLMGWGLNGQGQHQSHTADKTVWAQSRRNKQKRYVQTQSTDKAFTRYQTAEPSIWEENMEMEEP